MATYLYLGVERVTNPSAPTLVCARTETLNLEFNILSLIKFQAFKSLAQSFHFVPIVAKENVVVPINNVLYFNRPLLALPVADPILYQPFLRKLVFEEIIEDRIYLEALMALNLPYS